MGHRLAGKRKRRDWSEAKCYEKRRRLVRS